MVIVWTGIVLVPLVVNPLTPAVAEAVQANVVPATPDVNVTKLEVVPEQIVWVRGVFDKVGNWIMLIATGALLIEQEPLLTVTI